MDKDNIPQDRLKKLYKITTRSDFNLESIDSRVPSAGDLARFCVAVREYADISERVRPKKEQVAKLTAELDTANNALQLKLNELNKVKQNVQRLREETNKMMEKKKELENLMELTE